MDRNDIETKKYVCALSANAKIVLLKLYELLINIKVIIDNSYIYISIIIMCYVYIYFFKYVFY